MANPTPFEPGFDYSDFEASNPTRPKPGNQLDNDFANLQRTTDETIDALGDVRRSDGALQNNSVGPDQLSPALSIGFSLRGTWAPDVQYFSGDGVVWGDVFYKARVQHVSTPETQPDLSPDTWMYLFSIVAIAIPDGSITDVMVSTPDTPGEGIDSGKIKFIRDDLEAVSVQTELEGLNTSVSGKVDEVSEFGSSTVDVMYRLGTNYESKGTVEKPETRPFLHDFRPRVADGSAFNTDGGNLFIGPGAGNFTMSALPDIDVPAGTDPLLQTSHNTGIGVQALGLLTIGYKNVALGNNALRKLTEGHGNTAVGRDAGHELTTGSECTFLGFTAGQLVQTGPLNTIIGTAAGYNNADGQGNTVIGRRAMFNFTSGSYNVGVGELAAFGHTSGDYNIYLGKQAANAGITTGSSNTIIGSRIGGLPNVDGQVVIADGAGNKYVNIQPNGTAATVVDLPSRNVDAANTAATNGQTTSGSTLLLRSLANVGNALTQIVFQSRVGQPYARIVSSGGATPYLAFVTSNVEALRIDPNGNLRLKGATGPMWTTGAGDPNSVVSAPVGSLYTRTDGGASTTLYVKETGTGNTGWVAK